MLLEKLLAVSLCENFIILLFLLSPKPAENSGDQMDKQWIVKERVLFCAVKIDSAEHQTGMVSLGNIGQFH